MSATLAHRRDVLRRTMLFNLALLKVERAEMYPGERPRHLRAKVFRFNALVFWSSRPAWSFHVGRSMVLALQARRLRIVVLDDGKTWRTRYRRYYEERTLEAWIDRVIQGEDEYRAYEAMPRLAAAVSLP